MSRKKRDKNKLREYRLAHPEVFRGAKRRYLKRHAVKIAEKKRIYMKDYMARRRAQVKEEVKEEEGKEEDEGS